jgi:glycogen debranching enzyme
MVPTTPSDEAGFDPKRYWRGPVWVNVNWMIARGLEALGLREEARLLAADTLAMVRATGLHEYFHAQTGEGLGGGDFSWSAALVIDLLRRPIA